MRYSIGFMFVLAGLVALPQSVNAQGDQRTEQEPALDFEWLEFETVPARRARKGVNQSLFPREHR
jgi:hypothetical protein